MSKFGFGLANTAGLGRRQLIAFAIVSAIVNGIVTAGVGAWLAQTYAAYQRKTQSIQLIAELVYERRARAGMVVWAARRNAELDELRYRKRAYDEAYVAWNKRIQNNVFVIREISGEPGVTRIETQFQDMLVPALAETDRCLTAAYDIRLRGADPVPVLDACRMADLHQFTLDCAATITNELSKMTRLSFLPFSAPSASQRAVAIGWIDKACQNMPKPLVVPPPAPAATVSTIPGQPVK